MVHQDYSIRTFATVTDREKQQLYLSLCRTGRRVRWRIEQIVNQSSLLLFNYPL